MITIPLRARLLLYLGAGLTELANLTRTLFTAPTNLAEQDI